MDKLVVSSSPHIHSGVSTQKIMLDVIIALLPASIAAVVLFGLKAFVLISVSVATAVISEFLFNLIIKKKQTVGDLSAVITGLLLALSLPATTTVWQIIVGAAFAIVVVKCLFGGIGCNFANPAVTARVMLLIAFTSSVAGGTNPTLTDLTAGATPLAAIKGGATADTLPSLLDMLLGNRGGAIGETCAIALILGGIYLIARRVISWHTPVIYVATVFVLSLIIKQDVTMALYQVLGGGLMIGAIYMATDYSTSPTNTLGKVVFALGCGVLTVVVRFLGGLPEGASYAILMMNILSPYIEKWTAKKPLGGKR